MTMDLYNRLKRNPKQFLAFTGMYLHTFETLRPQFEQAFLKLDQERKTKTVRSQSERQRQMGGGNAFQNDLPNRLLMLLLYYRLYLTQEFLTLFFNAANKSLISRNITLKRDQKKINALRSSLRVRVEHTISRRKKYRIASEEYRNRDGDYDQTMNIVGGLVNLRAYERVFQRTGVRL
jgi:hypothetical protein